MVQYFIDGGAFMWPILFSLLFGLAFAFERAYSLVLSSIDSNKFYEDISSSMQSGKLQDAVDLCSETRGPVAGVFHAALSRYDRGLEEVEKAMENAGSLEMAFLEKNMIWLNTVITVAPMIGFTGTVVGISTNIFGSGFVRNFVPSFSWGGSSGFSLYKLSKFFEVTEKVLARRSRTFDKVEQDILKCVYDMTKRYRNE